MSAVTDYLLRQARLIRRVVPDGQPLKFITSLEFITSYILHGYILHLTYYILHIRIQIKHYAAVFSDYHSPHAISRSSSSLYISNEGAYYHSRETVNAICAILGIRFPDWIRLDLIRVLTIQSMWIRNSRDAWSGFNTDITDWIQQYSMVHVTIQHQNHTDKLIWWLHYFELDVNRTGSIQPTVFNEGSADSKNPWASGILSEPGTAPRLNSIGEWTIGFYSIQWFKLRLKIRITQTDWYAGCTIPNEMSTELGPFTQWDSMRV